MIRNKAINKDELDEVFLGKDINIAGVDVSNLFPTITCRKPSMEVKPFLRAV